MNGADAIPESGLEQVRRLVQSGTLSNMLGHMNIRVTEVDPGRATLEATPLPEFDNMYSRTHGGFAATLIDSAMGVAVASKLSAGASAGTIDLNVKYVRKIDVATGRLFARGVVVHAGHTLLTAEARVEDANGLLYAHGSGSFLVYTPR